MVEPEPPHDSQVDAMWKPPWRKWSFVPVPPQRPQGLRFELGFSPLPLQLEQVTTGWITKLFFVPLADSMKLIVAETYPINIS